MKVTNWILVLAVSFLGTVAVSARTINVPENHQTIQDGILAAQANDTVQVADGEYTGLIDFGGRDIVVIGNPEMAENVIINGERQGTVVTFDSNETPSTQLIGFAIVNGQGANGGGILISSASPTLENLIVMENTGNVGGGIYIVGESAPIITNVMLFGNHVATNGGAIAIWRGSATLTNVSIFGDMENPAQMGGGLYISNGSANIDGIMMAYCNGRSGGAFSLWNSQVALNRVLLIGNIAENGGAFYINGGTITLDHVTSFYNTAQSDNASNVFTSGANVTLKNSIFTDDMDETTPLMIFHEGSVSIDYCDIIGGQGDIINDQADLVWGDENIDGDPGFIDIEEGDFSIGVDSPCLDAGDPDSDPDPDGTITDIGAIYFHQRDIAIESNEILFDPIEWDQFEAMPLIVMNEGGNDLTITIAEAEEETCISMSEAEGIPMIIEPYGMLELQVIFYATEGLPLSRTIVINSDDPDEPEIHVEAIGEVLSVATENQTLSDFNLHSAFPNPFNSQTTIRFSVDPINRETTSLRVYGLDGRLVADLSSRDTSPQVAGKIIGYGDPTVGERAVVWNAEGLPGGIYLVCLESVLESRTMKVVLLK